jgi:RNA polymerase sigma-70 factor (sigma-E family)
MTRAPDLAFLEFVRSRAAPLHRMAYLLCGDWHLADDLVQETLAKSFRHWHRIQRADNPDAYVRRMLVNEVRRHWRRHRNAAGPVDVTAWEPGVPDDAAAVTNRVVLFQALLSLPARQRATVVLRYLEGMSERETAAILGCGEGTVKSQTSRALGSLRTFLEPEGYGNELPA